MALCRLGLRAAEGEFQARNYDLIGRLLAAMKAEEENASGGSPT
jgi:hypothetical protein